MLTPLILVLSASAATPDVDAPALFLEHCAACHGEKGDGRGTTPLPRAARSFLDGGFSYGNTRAAIGRTIEHGIPGTPMPSFVPALGAEQRAALVEFVIALGPERKEVQLAETLLVVGQRPLVARGNVPPLAEGVPGYPRGLLLGLTSGTTFQYRADDVRLLAVRQGDFVERRDWGGRGGAPLRPLGTVTHLVDGGNPGPVWTLGEDALRARLTRTAVRDQKVVISYDLQLDGRVVARIEETPSNVSSSAGGGFRRELHIEALDAAVELGFRWSAPVQREVEKEMFTNIVRGQGVHENVFTYVEDSARTGPGDESIGSVRLIAVVAKHPDLGPTATVDASSLRIELQPGEHKYVRLYQATLVDLDAKQRFLEEMYR